MDKSVGGNCIITERMGVKMADQVKATILQCKDMEPHTRPTHTLTAALEGKKEKREISVKRRLLVDTE